MSIAPNFGGGQEHQGMLGWAQCDQVGVGSGNEVLLRGEGGGDGVVGIVREGGGVIHNK